MLKLWEKFRLNNHRSKSYIAVIDTLEKFGELTSGEIDQKSGKHGLWKRLNDMRLYGLIESTGVRKCTVTNRPSRTWKLRDLE